MSSTLLFVRGSATAIQPLIGLRFPDLSPRCLKLGSGSKVFHAHITTSYSIYHQQAMLVQENENDEELILLIRDELATLEERSIKNRRVLFECLELVDLIQRLGINRYFEDNIRRIFRTTMMMWDEEYGLGDAEVTVLAFRLLRLQGYHVSSDVLKSLKDGTGKFFGFSIESPIQIMSMVNFYKCSQINFPFESNLMDEAMSFSSSQLNRALIEKKESMLQMNNLRSEVKFALDYPRRYLLPRMESRRIIRQLWPSNESKKKCLELAKRDLENLQKHHTKEMTKIESWWEEQEVKDFPFSRGQVVKCFFTISMTIFEQEFSAFRAAFTKSAVIITLIDDLFDYPSSDFSGTSRFIEAVKRWDPSQLDGLHEHKAVFACLERTMINMATEASMAQGRDLLPFYKSVFHDTVVASSKEAEWRHTQYVPTLKEYLENATISIGALGCFWTSVFLLGEPITDNIVRHVGRHSRFIYLVSLISRLANDIATYRREAMGGEMATAVGCHMRDNPGCTEEEAITSLRQIMESACKELEWEIFSCIGVVPECCSRAILNFARIMCLIYKKTDAFTDSLEMDFEELIKDYLFGSFR